MADDRTLGDLQRETGVPVWQLRRWLDGGQLGVPYHRVYRYRLIRAADFPLAVKRVRELLARRQPAEAVSQ